VIRNVLLDTGPLVAGLVRRDAFHGWASSQFKLIEPPLLTCEAVLTEACHLLGEFPEGIRQIDVFLEQRIIQTPFVLLGQRERVFSLMRSYRNVPMSLADACLVCMAESIPDSRVFTLDGDFRIYRQHGRKQIPLLIP
jgi:predicted nucleic acid-binding protein